MLPKIDVPIYTITLPLSKKKIRFRPFLVKEEKLLLMAMESGEQNTVIGATKQIVNNCCLDDIDIEKIAIVDFEYLFLNLRARSVNEIVDLKYKCNNKIKGEDGSENDCGNVVNLKVNILEIEPTVEKNHTNKIELTKNMGVVMQYPNFKLLEKENYDSDVEKIMEIICECVDYIYDEDNIYYKKDISKEEITEFIESMTKDQFAKVQKFFDTIPKIKKEIDFKCNKCGYSEIITLEGIQNFFV
ncbi:MAG: baseplate protein [Candidatus Nanopelagicales bacterium]